jgi:AraC-like DNA-binding protein
VSEDEGELTMRAVHSAERKDSLYLTSPDAEPTRVEAGDSDSLTYVKLGTLIALAGDGRIRRILRVIESHPSRKIHELALDCNLSPSHLQHLFKQSTGLGLGQLLTEQRMQRATDFLAHSNMSIKEIASTLGYEHTSSFTRAFERRFLQAPSSYRQKQDRDQALPRNC